MNVVFTLETYNRVLYTSVGSIEESIFLAGPTRRNSPYELSWRKDAVNILDRLGFTGNVFVPEPRNFDDFDFENAFGTKKGLHLIHNWEWDRLQEADKIVFWIPRNIEDGMPAFTTNIEFGYWMAKNPEKVFLGYPDNAERNDYIEDLYTSINKRYISNNLEDLLKYTLRYNI
jgi:hypothetical protein